MRNPCHAASFTLWKPTVMPAGHRQLHDQSILHPTTTAIVCMPQGLAKSIAWDGEGATCLMEIECVGAKSDGEARQVARSVAGSHLAKAAIFGHDPNWGRLAAAAGYSGVQFDQNDLGVQLGSMVLMANGQPLEFDKGKVR